MKLTSPNYPEPYDPLEHCTWRIVAPQGHYVTLDFDTIDVSILFYLIPLIVPFLNICIFDSLIINMMVITYPYKRLEIKN